MLNNTTPAPAAISVNAATQAVPASGQVVGLTEASLTAVTEDESATHEIQAAVAPAQVTINPFANMNSHQGANVADAPALNIVSNQSGSISAIQLTATTENQAANDTETATAASNTESADAKDQVQAANAPGAADDADLQQDADAQGIDQTMAAENQDVDIAAIDRALIKKHGVDKLDIPQAKLLIGAVLLYLDERRKAEIKILMQDFHANAAALDVSGPALLDELKGYLNHQGLGQGLRKASNQAGASKDSTGHGPVVGVTYQHPDCGITWTKKQVQGSAKKEFVEAVQAGYTWDEMKVND